MDKRLAVLPLVLLAGTSLSGCVAAAIPALAGSAIVGKRVIGTDAPAAAEPAPEAPPAPAAEPVVAKTPPVATPVVIAAAPPPPPPAAAPASAPVAGAVPVMAQAPAALPAPVERSTGLAVGEPAAYPDPAYPLSPGQANFARFVRYAQESARQAATGVELPSAVLSDPVALDGKRRRCAAGEQLVAVIDLDPVGGTFAPPSSPSKLTGLGIGLSILRQAGVEIAWISDLSTTQSGAVRTALEQSGLDPRGQDIISLAREESDAKDQRRSSLAAITCIVAIAGDERADFDGRVRYLRTPEAGAGLEPLIGDGWFLIEPLLGN